MPTASQEQSDNDQVKRFRSRKIYIEHRIPRVKAEIAAIATRKRSLKESGGEASKHVIEEMIYNNQHLVALRKELQSLEQERKSVLKGLKEIRLQETGKTESAASP
ncbi:MAG TPA: hypothetical protein VKR31_12825 [Rhizomicrobium sp.]|nr:hypothetical protein [Rhizomicrobium sp.]